MKQARSQPHWFMMKYFEYAGRTVEDCYRQLFSMTEDAENLVRERSRQAPERTAGPCIPRILHKLWLTNPEAPSEPLDDYITALVEDASRLHESGWQVFVWLQDEELVPAAVGKLRKSEGSIQIRQIRDHVPHGKWLELFDRFLADRKFPFAADVLRMVILHQYGGFYGDLGVRIQHIDIANFIADDFDYSFIFWDTMFFQNSFMAMAPRSELSQIFMKLLDDPYLVPRSLIEPLTALSEGQAFSGLMVTAILLSIWRADLRVFPFVANRQLLTWSAQQSWYRPERKYGNTYVPDSEPSFYSEATLRERGAGSQAELGI